MEQLNRCLCGKQCHKTENDALKAAELGQWRKPGEPALSVYRCLLCMNWHLTSSPRKPQKHKKRSRR